MRRLYSPQRYSTNPLEHARLQKVVVEGFEKQFIPLIGFRDQSTWSKRCADPRIFKEAELRIIAKFFHLHELTEPSEEAWRLLTDQYSYEEFNLRLVKNAYGTFESYRGILPTPAGDSATAADFLHALMAFSAAPLDIEVLELTRARGAAERDELEEQALLRRLPPGASYAYRLGMDRKVTGFLYVFEISSDARGRQAACAMVAPSPLHAELRFANPTLVPEPFSSAARTGFTMSDRFARCTTVGVVTDRALTALPRPAPDRNFAWLGLETIRLLARQIADQSLQTTVYRGLFTLGLKT
ncbi:hypothetical protein [Caulobacter soli]|uniref:hypothetical protein n=1 Tax=Caulobacter soli TaxID=2708539 RepID=UPI0013EE21C7|nr:hypothetical protein [Caulobacter soli]